jgi:peptidoglycan/xylan/chitin deacetylase (PgdA/CDA1 family)
VISRVKKSVMTAFKSPFLVQKQFNTLINRNNTNRNALILQYHSVRPLNDTATADPGKNITVTPHVFEKQIIFLKKYYNIVSLNTLIQYIEGNYKSDKIPVALTFDDGYHDNYLYAYPVLKRYNVPAMIYLTTDCIDNKTFFWPLELKYFVLNYSTDLLKIEHLEKEYLLGNFRSRMLVYGEIKKHLITLPRIERESIISEIKRHSGIQDMNPLKRTMLTWNEVRQMCRDGIDFGSHTLSHPSLPYVPREEAKQEILHSKEVIENQINEPVVHFSYPNPGDFDNVNTDIMQLVKRADYASATTSEKGYVTYGDNLLELKRKGIYYNLSTLTDFYFEIEKELFLPSWMQHRMSA